MSSLLSLADEISEESSSSSSSSTSSLKDEDRSDTVSSSSRDIPATPERDSRWFLACFNNDDWKLSRDTPSSKSLFRFLQSNECTEHDLLRDQEESIQNLEKKVIIQQKYIRTIETLPGLSHVLREQSRALQKQGEVRGYMRYLHAAALVGDIDALVEFAERLIEMNNHKDAILALQRACKKGHAKAARLLSRIYELGLCGVSKSPHVALTYMEEAVRHGDDLCSPYEKARLRAKIQTATSGRAVLSPLNSEKRTNDEDLSSKKIIDAKSMQEKFIRNLENSAKAMERKTSEQHETKESISKPYRT